MKAMTDLNSAPWRKGVDWHLMNWAADDGRLRTGAVWVKGPPNLICFVEAAVWFEVRSIFEGNPFWGVLKRLARPRDVKNDDARWSPDQLGSLDLLESFESVFGESEASFPTSESVRKIIDDNTPEMITIFCNFCFNFVCFFTQVVNFCPCACQWNYDRSKLFCYVLVQPRNACSFLLVLLHFFGHSNSSTSPSLLFGVWLGLTRLTCPDFK
jgi:hypothetical protein